VKRGTDISVRRLLEAADPSLFRGGHDRNDRMLGEAVAHDFGAYDDARLVLLGCPQDEGVRRNRGRPGAADAPTAIRHELFGLSAPRTLGRTPILDAGNIRVAPTLEGTHRRQRSVVSAFIADGKSVVVLGGGNDISYPDASALADVRRPMLAFNVDSHFDVRDSQRANSGTPYRQLLETGAVAPENLYQMGHKPGANSPEYVRYLERAGVRVYSFDEIERRGVETTFSSILQRRQEAQSIFWGIDMDSVRSSDAPGVSAGYPLGFTAAQICRIAALAGRDPRTGIFEISECNPGRDIDGRTAKLAAMMIVSFLEALGSSADTGERPPARRRRGCRG
jgi:formiminoglutamase